ncbi:fatty acid--CoA ligase family protein [Accumulibacter sp.]|uniref:class I adenylate-forming enzyme family protein n=1 Tax=Accumulibacter sp. TaxID=2053492 RepID=UPI0025D9CDCD|nr:fatty acid--CoA ligase family protein [Accumulibacter sp.]MCM8613498.1 fatty acid--CoA ligase family protein [Accumulibacter sp.]MCM8637187.1 fatty acid--CoA ligase family protein [Accumulibacter sp.]MCM8640749.1 fatty acid--CoA ligase family protein [Accumulibacter sp.]
MSLLASWLAEAAGEHPHACALRTAAGEWAYGELLALAGRGAACLRRSGIAAGGIVGCAAAAPDLALAAVACSAAGAALLPLDPLTAAAAWPRLQELAGGRLHCLRTPSGDWPPDRAPPAPAVDADGLALVIASSGSEGEPKAVMLTAGNLAAAVAASQRRLPLTAGDTWLGCLPLHHVGGIALLYRCLRAGATLLLHSRFSAPEVWRDIDEQAVSHISLVPVMLARLLDVAGGRPPPASLRHALIGGGALSRPLCERALATGWPIRPSWGLSESAAQAATLLQPGLGWRPGLVGELLPGLAVRIAADGRICLRGAQVMAGYLNPQRRPGLGLADGWLITGDLGDIDAAGRLSIRGRADELLVSGGVNVHPAEVEDCLAACPGVRDVAVTATSDPEWGDSLLALVVGQPDLQLLRDWSRQHLPTARRPRRFRCVDRLPRNAMGKLERAALRRLAAEDG